MENLLDTKNGLGGLLASIAVIAALHLIFRVVEFLWEMLRRKNEISDKSVERLTTAITQLELELKELQKEHTELPKLKLDLRRLYTATKMLADDKWPEIRKVIMEDDLL